MLKEELMNELKEAMRDKNEIKKNTVQMVRAAILQFEKDNAVEVDDNKIVEIIAKQVKEKKDAMVEIEKGAREDLIKQTTEEIEILSKYLPKQLSKEEIKPIIEEVIKAVGATSMKDMGNVMREAKAKIGVAADGRTINEVVKELLG